MIALRRAGIITLALLSMLAMSGSSCAQDTPGEAIRKVGFDQNLDTQVPMGLAFRDEAGRPVLLGDYFGERPVILTLVYYRCPMLCTQELNGLARSLKPLAMSVGEDFDIVTLSIDPDEKPELAASKKNAYLERYDRPGAEAGWHFLTGDAKSIAELARVAGFRYVRDEKTGLYNHAAGLVILTPEGRIARYYYGIDYPAKDLQLSLIEASAGKIGSPIARLLLLCYHYDPATGKYSLAIVRLLQVFGTITALGLGGYIAVMTWRERRVARTVLAGE